MKEKDALEQYLEDKLAEKQFTYQASYWDQAAGQMATWDAEARRKKRFLWFYLFSGVVFISLAITGIFALTLRGTPDSQLSELNDSSQVSSLSESFECDSNTIASIALPLASTERSPKVSSPTSNMSNSSRPSNQNRRSNRRTTNTNTQSQNPTSPPLSSKSLTEIASPNSQTLTTKIERSAQQLKTKYSLKKILNRNFAFQNFLDTAFSDQAEAEQSKHASINYYIQTGAGFSASQMGESGASLQGGQSTASFGIRYNIRPGLALESGIQYHSKRLDNLSLSLSGRQFDFVAREQTIRWQVEQLHWVSIPLRLSLRPLKRHEFSLGASVDWLATSRGTLRESQQDPFSAITNTDLNGNGIVYGLRTFNYSAQLGYRFYVHPRMALDMRYRYGFRNLLDKEVWTTEEARFDRQFQVGLMFYLK